MSVDCPQIECKFHNDPRLMVGVSTIIVHAAAHAGLGEREQESLAQAAVKACQERFCCGNGNLAEDSLLQIGVSSFSDRVEVNIDFPEETTHRDGKSSVKLVQHREVVKSKPRQ